MKKLHAYQSQLTGNQQAARYRIRILEYEVEY